MGSDKVEIAGRECSCIKCYLNTDRNPGVGRDKLGAWD